MTMKVTARRLAPTPPAIALILGVLALAVLTVTVPLSLLAHQATFSDTSGGIGITVCFGGVGVLVARRQPRNPVGWLLISFVLFSGLSVAAGYYALLRYRLGHTGLPLGSAAACCSRRLWTVAIALLPPVILLFPDGRLASRRWRRLLWAYAGLVTCVLITVCAPAAADVVRHDIHVDSSATSRGRLICPAGSLTRPHGWPPRS